MATMIRGFSSKIIKLILAMNIKTLYFNFKYLPLLQAIKLPVFISQKVVFLKTKGTVKIYGKIRSGMIQIGFPSVGIFDHSYSRSIWQVSGIVIFHGKAFLGQGTKLSVRGTVEFGDNFITSAETSIIADKNNKFW